MNPGGLTIDAGCSQWLLTDRLRQNRQAIADTRRGAVQIPLGEAFARRAVHALQPVMAVQWMPIVAGRCGSFVGGIRTAQHYPYSPALDTHCA